MFDFYLLDDLFYPGQFAFLTHSFNKKTEFIANLIVIKTNLHFFMIFVQDYSGFQYSVDLKSAV